MVVFTGGKWKVWVRTNELPSAGTQSQVNITVYGHKGNSGPLPLGIPKDETFHSGSVDMFDVCITYICFDIISNVNKMSFKS